MNITRVVIASLGVGTLSVGDCLELKTLLV